MTTVYRAHIFKERSVGEREEVRLKIFGPNGAPLNLSSGGGLGGGSGGEGGAAMLLDSWQQSFVPQSDEQVKLPLGGNGIVAQQGFELAEGDRSFAAPAGAYFVSLSFTPSWEGAPPESGFMIILPEFDYVDGDGNSNSLNPFTIQIGVGYDPARPHEDFDGPFMQDGFVKQGFFIAPYDGEFSVQAMQTAISGGVTVINELSVAKL